MIKPIKIVLFSEINSKYGYFFLHELCKWHHVEISLLVTRPDNQFCRYYVHDNDQINLKAEALKLKIPVFQPTCLDNESTISKLACLNADYFIVTDYQKKLPQSLIKLPKMISINFHPSLLPKYAGRSPAFWMAKYGETQAGVSAIMMNEEIHQGNIMAQLSIKLTGTETANDIQKITFINSIKLLKLIIPYLLERYLTLIPQELSQRTYFNWPKPNDYLIEWGRHHEEIFRTVRAGYRYPGAFALTEDGKKMIIFSVEKSNFFDEILNSMPVGSLRCINKKWCVRTTDSLLVITSIDSGNEQIELSDKTPLHEIEFIR